MKAILDTYPGFELFPGTEQYLLDGLRAGAVGTISATANVACAAMRKVFDNWQGPDADRLQADVTALRKTIQGFPVIPFLKAMVAHYRGDPGWAELRPPFVAMPEADAKAAIQTVADLHGFKLSFEEA